MRVQREHSQAARCTSTGDYLVCPLFFDRHFHSNRYQRIVEFVARGGDDLVHDIHPPEDFTKDGVGAVQPAAIIDTDIELRAVIVRVTRAVALARNLGHADRASFVRPIAGFRIEPVAGTARPVQGTICGLAQGIAGVVAPAMQAR